MPILGNVPPLRRGHRVGRRRANVAPPLVTDVHVLHGLALPEAARALPEHEGALCRRYVCLLSLRLLMRFVASARPSRRPVLLSPVTDPH